MGVVELCHWDYNVALPRIGRGTIQVPAGTQSLDIWFSVTDDNLFPYNLTYNKVKFSKKFISIPSARRN